MQSSKPIISVIGGTGHLGSFIVKGLLSQPWRENFSEVRVLSRSLTSETALELQKLGAKLVPYNDTSVEIISALLQGTDILINTLSHKAHDIFDTILQAACNSNVKVYFPSEFGYDHRHKDFPHPMWDSKLEHQKKARESGIKTCAVYTSLFLEDSIGPWFGNIIRLIFLNGLLGMNTKGGQYEAIGTGKEISSFTSLIDVGKSVAALCSMSYDKIPEHVRLSGTTASIQEIATIMSSVSGLKIEVTTVPYDEFRKKILEVDITHDSDPAPFIKLAIGNGTFDHSKDSSNEIVNPGESLWKWKTMQQYAEEVGGKPWF